MSQSEFTSALLAMMSNLQRFALSLTAEREKALDLVQDTYLKALNSCDKFADSTNLRAWLFTIMKNTFINNYRRKAKENTIFDNTKDLYFINLPNDNGFTAPESNYEEAEIEGAIDSLNTDFSTLLRLHIEGYKYKEIAEKLDLKMCTVKSRIYLSRQKLMMKLKDYAG